MAVRRSTTGARTRGEQEKKKAKIDPSLLLLQLMKWPL